MNAVSNWNDFFLSFFTTECTFCNALPTLVDLLDLIILASLSSVNTDKLIKWWIERRRIIKEANSSHSHRVYFAVYTRTINTCFSIINTRRLSNSSRKESKWNRRDLLEDLPGRFCFDECNIKSKTIPKEYSFPVV